MKGERLSQRQIATLTQLAVCISNGGQASLSPTQREAMAPLWRRGLIEVWFRMVPDEGSRGPFYRPSSSGWNLISALLSPRSQKLEGIG